ncbi:methyltransferase domain-containing protein [Candidatus Woesearchaeota archaeon]|nr:methyltransferase domain-containing protein [Candidatus Woesearchaeota archaeon]
MKHIFFLSGDYISLGEEEIVSLLDIKNHRLADRLLIANLNEELDEKLVKRLALTKSVYRLLFECKINDLTETMKSFGWNSFYKPSFCLRIYDFNDKPNNVKHNKQIKNKKILNPVSEKKLAGYIWRSVQNPKVSLENPKTLIQLFIIKDKAYCGLLIYTNKEDFESRRSHLRPFPHPSSLHPKVARALVNLTGIKENETLLDPFCGTGGIMMESGLMNSKSIGYDIDKLMINGCIENLKHYNIKKYRIKRQNALKISDKFDYAVTDLPYGLNSNVILTNENGFRKENRINKKTEVKNFVKNLEKFYLSFLKNLRKKLKKRAVIVFPSYVDYKKLLKMSRFKIEKEFSIYVHRSLTRKIVKVS